MAGNNSILILRSGTSGSFDRTQSDHLLLDGQLFWDRENGWLFIGSLDTDGKTLKKLKDLHSIQVDYSNNCLTAHEVLDIWTNTTGTIDECDCTECGSKDEEVLEGDD